MKYLEIVLLAALLVLAWYYNSMDLLMPLGFWLVGIVLLLIMLVDLVLKRKSKK